jgi:hypothetical protein
MPAVITSAILTISESSIVAAGGAVGATIVQASDEVARCANAVA